MSLARALVRPQATVSRTFFQRRAYSGGHHDHDGHAAPDTTVYPSETFFNSFWRNAVLATIAVGALVKFAPEASDDAYLSRMIAESSRSTEKTLDILVNNTAVFDERAGTHLLLTNAKKRTIHRVQMPQLLEQASPYDVPTGYAVDVSAVKVKSERE
ncbi:hypothetical protein FISHEDRAFT_71806 [Fistulina hepatica ATCC 64428]|uniref:Uncharacterized protein n=1 Tax=Fistulina hepatica ATCC 64428 TaxID=1128425 RepID=A0A0D7AFK9_9AGAR|nr:hypothetical protein FISHEDRAFT_71806 [Fistulina hepatica ATCC 64428]